MKATSVIMLVLKAALAAAVLFISTVILFAQDKAAEKAGLKVEKMQAAKEFCGGNWSNGDKVGFKELREMTLPASGSLAVDGGKNGGISVKGAERGDILVKACVQTWGISEEAARAAAGNIRIETGGTLRASNGTSEEGWGVSYQILVPRGTDLNLKAHNGGISIMGVDSRMEFETLNGGIHLMDVGGDIRGRTTNGGVHVALGGNSWRGSGLDLLTTNGGVHLSIPETYAANIETGTTNGGFHSNIPALNVTQEDVKGRERGNRAVRLNTSLNGGGAPLRLMTTNGGVHISSSTDKSIY